ncbi:MAG: MHS family MFS transporter [Hyphomicrobiales bacterium]|nr:MHS family MFS transporter [Hyphomicrobiales bacterium]
MSATTASTSPMSDAEHQRQLTKAVFAATVGTAIEWYDFFLYIVVTGTVFNKLFFPQENPLNGTLSAFGIYAVGFLSRPIGAYIFGNFGDRIGRKATLVSTLLIMGIATFLVAFVPDYSSIGVWGAVILTVLRFVQGVGVGGEWGGSVLLSMEWARTNQNRGFLAAWPQFGVPAGLMLANLAVLIFTKLSGDQFLVWGWRWPFGLSIMLVALGLWIRLGILETPVFARVQGENKVAVAPASEVIASHWPEILLSAYARMSEQTPFYIFTAFVGFFVTVVMKQPPTLALWAVMGASAVSFVSNPLFGAISDRIGRKRMYAIGSALIALYGFAYYGMLSTGNATLIVVAVVLSLIPHDMQYGPQAAMIAESFPPRLRYSGASMGYQLASVFAGGPAPLVATMLYGFYKTPYAIAVYIAVCSAITIAATWRLKDYTGRDIDAGDGAVRPMKVANAPLVIGLQAVALVVALWGTKVFGLAGSATDPTVVTGSLLFWAVATLAAIFLMKDQNEA